MLLSQQERKIKKANALNQQLSNRRRRKLMNQRKARRRKARRRKARRRKARRRKARRRKARRRKARRRKARVRVIDAARCHSNHYAYSKVNVVLSQWLCGKVTARVPFCTNKDVIEVWFHSFSLSSSPSPALKRVGYSFHAE